MTMPETLKPDELVERLKSGAMELNHRQGINPNSTIFGKAADRILALQADLERVTQQRDDALTKLREIENDAH